MIVFWRQSRVKRRGSEENSVGPGCSDEMTSEQRPDGNERASSEGSWWWNVSGSGNSEWKSPKVNTRLMGGGRESGGYDKWDLPWGQQHLPGPLLLRGILELRRIVGGVVRQAAIWKHFRACVSDKLPKGISRERDSLLRFILSL